MEKEKVLFVYNPRAGKGTLRNKLADIIDMMMKRQWDVSIAAEGWRCSRIYHTKGNRL